MWARPRPAIPAQLLLRGTRTREAQGRTLVGLRIAPQLLRRLYLRRTGGVSSALTPLRHIP
jgi:hypothetical protein